MDATLRRLVDDAPPPTRRRSSETYNRLEPAVRALIAKGYDVRGAVVYLAARGGFNGDLESFYRAMTYRTRDLRRKS